MRGIGSLLIEYRNNCSPAARRTAARAISRESMDYLVSWISVTIQPIIFFSLARRFHVMRLFVLYRICYLLQLLALVDYYYFLTDELWSGIAIALLSFVIIILLLV